MLPSHSTHGAPDGWPLVLIHGFPFHRRQWDPQLDALGEACRVITYDLRGHGRTPTGPGPVMIEFLVDDLVELLDREGLERATLCGLSMGGYVALRMIDRHPDRVHGLILCDTKAEADSNEGRVKRADAIRAIRTKGMEGFAASLLPALFGAEAVAADGPGVRMIRQQILEADPEGACHALGAMACRLDLAERLPQVATPTLILVGEHDTLTPPSDARRMQEAIPGARLVVIPGAGHVSNVDDPGTFNTAVLAFLRDLQRDVAHGDPR